MEKTANKLITEFYPEITFVMLMLTRTEEGLAIIELRMIMRKITVA